MMRIVRTTLCNFVMMKKEIGIWVLMAAGIFLMSCGGKLSDEERAKMKEGMKEQEIRRVLPAQIMAQAQKQGRYLQPLLKKHPAWADSLANAFHARADWVVPGKNSGSQLEQDLIDAMVQAVSNGIVEDNIQLDGDSVMYSFPVVDTLADKSVQYRGTWNVFFSKKYVILSMD